MTITVTIRRPDEQEYAWRMIAPAHVVEAILCSALEGLHYDGNTRVNTLIISDYDGTSLDGEKGRHKVFDLFAERIRQGDFTDISLTIRNGE